MLSPGRIRGSERGLLFLGSIPCIDLDVTENFGSEVGGHLDVRFGAGYERIRFLKLWSLLSGNRETVELSNCKQ
jgi:hypothetical protein